jgi:hypothetical protein
MLSRRAIDCDRVFIEVRFPDSRHGVDLDRVAVQAYSPRFARIVAPAQQIIASTNAQIIDWFPPQSGRRVGDSSPERIVVSAEEGRPSGSERPVRSR